MFFVSSSVIPFQGDISRQLSQNQHDQTEREWMHDSSIWGTNEAQIKVLIINRMNEVKLSSQNC